jgi:hypothetical protein
MLMLIVVGMRMIPVIYYSSELKKWRCKLFFSLVFTCVFSKKWVDSDLPEQAVKFKMMESIITLIHTLHDKLHDNVQSVTNENGANDPVLCEYCGNPIEACVCACPFCGESNACECCLYDAATGG